MDQLSPASQMARQVAARTRTSRSTAMKNSLCWAVGAAVALVTISSPPAGAADLSNAHGQSCGDAVGVWHFVNNQTRNVDGQEFVTLTAEFSDGSVWRVRPTSVNRNVLHFHVRSAGTIVSASTFYPFKGGLPMLGRLVLADYTCEDAQN
jgi:hypothetical protein